MQVDIVEELRRIPAWQQDPDKLLNGAKRGRTPDGRHKAEVIKIEPEEDFELPSAAVSMDKRFPLANFVGVEPALLRDEDSTSYVDCDGMEYAVLRGRYCIVNRTIVFFAELNQCSLQFCYVVCHPDFAVAHSVRTCEEQRSMANRNPLSVERKPICR